MKNHKYCIISSILFGSAMSLSAQLTRDNFNDWPGGFRAEFSVTNNTSDTTFGWLAVLEMESNLTFELNNAELLSSRSNPSEGIYAFTNVDFNANLSPGQSANFGFNVNLDNDSTPPTSGSLTLGFVPGQDPSFSISDAEALELSLIHI